MNRIYLIIGLVLLLFFQVFILNNINFLGYINPYLYVLFVFVFPVSKNRFPLLFMAFLYGLLVDLFSDSGGIHAFSLLFVAYIRILLIKTIFQKSDTDLSLFKLKSESFGKVFNYVVILTVIHHFILFSLANFSFQNFSGVLLNTLFSSVFTLILYFFGTFIFSKKSQ
ncbi:rod shape-determining protein MreD [Flavobacteriaceae bacterium S356]|uniref:Rod shape-determining protein MreD n=1 Tax=Asprobacillus argus TaxID=3076534 RepID=A0ABU3LFJ4_9FLAO|nr:rod shape-determining protein MreD [Flavobacteriaceae bacterium S356]